MKTRAHLRVQWTALWDIFFLWYLQKSHLMMIDSSFEPSPCGHLRNCSGFAFLPCPSLRAALKHAEVHLAHTHRHVKSTHLLKMDSYTCRLPLKCVWIFIKHLILSFFYSWVFFRGVPFRSCLFLPLEPKAAVGGLLYSVRVVYCPLTDCGGEGERAEQVDGQTERYEMMVGGREWCTVGKCILWFTSRSCFLIRE